MDKQTKIIIGVVVGLAVIGGIWYFGFRKPKPTPKDETKKTMTQAEADALAKQFSSSRGASKEQQDKWAKIEKQLSDAGYSLEVSGDSATFKAVKK
jgi:hypothetical protein